MKMKLRKFMQQAASYIEIVLSAFLLIAIIFLQENLLWKVYWE